MWSLKVVKGADLAEKLVPEVRLPEPLVRFIIGRDPAAGWSITDRTLALSARHCEIVPSAHGPVLRDLSTNGTFVNDAAARLSGEHVLRDGDRIEIGPFLIAVSGPPMPPRPEQADAPRTEMPSRSPGVMATAPHRGGDPAAMLAAMAAGGHEPVRLTEMLRVASPVDDAGLDLTRIRIAQPAAPRAPSPPPAVPSPPPVAAPAAGTVARTVAPPSGASPAATPAADLPQALARGLGVDVAALQGHDPLVLAEQLAATARAAVAALRELGEHQAKQRRAIGSRALALASPRDANPLRRAATPEAALLQLTSAGGAPTEAVQRATAELRAHAERLIQAQRTALQRVAEQLTPEALEAALPPGTSAATQPAQLWALYQVLWDSLGLAPGQGWAAGLAEAAQQHLAAAYDEQATRQP